VGERGKRKTWRLVRKESSLGRHKAKAAKDYDEGKGTEQF